jgi:membrane associated rhomboid family serine protease
MIPLRDVNPVRRTPVVTIGLIVACVLAFLIELTVQLNGDPALDRFFDRWALVPAQLTAAFAGTDETAQVRELATVFSSMFLHGGWIHLGGNMLYLWIFGNNIEDRFGRLRFLAFYLLAGIAAAATQVLRDPGSEAPIIGASGAIAGVLGAYLVLYPRARVLSLVFLGSSLTGELFSAYPKGGCRWSDVATAINTAGAAPSELSGLPATAEEAIAAFAVHAHDVPGYQGGGAFPADGWLEYRGRWVHDWNDQIYLQATIAETPNGWRVDDYVACTR